VGNLTDRLRRVAAAPVRPFARYFNRRFAGVHGHLDNDAAALNARLDETVATTRSLQERVTTDLEVLSELTLSLERLVRQLEDRVNALEFERHRVPEPGPKA
jgi:archaellum component FlaC